MAAAHSPHEASASRHGQAAPVWWRMLVHVGAGARGGVVAQVDKRGWRGVALIPHTATCVHQQPGLLLIVSWVGMAFVMPSYKKL